MSCHRSLKFDLPFPRGLIEHAMPCHFGDPDAETDACQHSAAVFNFSFIIRLQISGPDADLALSIFCGRGFSDLPEGGIRYALHADSDGFLLSDVTVWRTGTDQFELMTGRPEDPGDLQQITGRLRAKITDLSDETAVFAVQGPNSEAVLTAMNNGIKIGAIPYFQFRDMPFWGQIRRIGRLGFTGLPGVEVLCSRPLAARLWADLSSHIRPAGMIAADRVRLSAGLALFNQEFQPPVTAADAGLLKFRPDGSTIGDLSRAKVCRVTFSARATGSIEPIYWSDGQPFPPQPGILAITSAARIQSENTVIGMGYLTTKDEQTKYIEPTGILDNISIIRRFQNNLNRSA